jgi:predicted TIM-barrel fold metal-dependent hydrolase
MELTAVSGEPAPAESILEPDLRIVDPHVHLWPSGFFVPYDVDAVTADLHRGHRVDATVFVECSAAYRSDGDPALRPVGETEFVVEHTPGTLEPRVAAGVVGWADLLEPSVARVLDAHVEAGDGRFRGVRDIVAWRQGEDHALGRPARPHVLVSDDYLRGLGALAERNLTFDVWAFFDQLPELCGLLDGLPGLTVVVDHLGGPVPFDGTPDGSLETFRAWRVALAEVAKRPNTLLKVGGLGMPVHRLLAGDERPSSDVVAEIWRPYVEAAIELFGPHRCMFESNFPIDKQSLSYDAVWNAFKLVSADWSPSERAAVFAETAASTYGLNDPGVRS